MSTDEITPSRETYAKLNANTFGPGRQGQTSTEAQVALDEIDHLRAVVKLAERALRDYPMQSYRNVNAQRRRALAIDACRKALDHE